MTEDPMQEEVAPHVEQFQEHRPLLFSVAYEMLGSVMEAEDVVQEVFLRWKDVDTTQVRSPKSYLAQIAGRLSLNRLRDQQNERERYPGPWLPEPLHEEGSLDPAVREEVVTTAFLRILETLTPLQRAVFLLREVFGMDYEDIAEATGTTIAAARKHVSRARHRLGEEDRRFDASPEDAEEVAKRFISCCRGADESGLMQLLAPDVVSLSDGGGEFPGAARRPVQGRRNVARLLLGAMRRAPDADAEITQLNRYPAVVFRRNDRAFGTITLRIREGEIQEVFFLVNPDKLGHLDG